MLLSRGKGHILTQVRNKMEIPVKDYIQEDCFTCRLNERYHCCPVKLQGAGCK